MAKLLVQESSGVREFELVDNEVKVGRELDNTLRLAAVGGDTDVSLVDFFRITYQRPFVAVGDTLAFSATAGRPARPTAWLRRSDARTGGMRRLARAARRRRLFCDWSRLRRRDPAVAQRIRLRRRA